MATRLDGGHVGGDAMADRERLPWLEAVEDDDEPAGPGAAKLIAAILVGLLAIAAIVGGSFWLGNRSGATGAGGQPELIVAEPGPYKVAVEPDEAGGMAVEGRGDTAFAASEGADPEGRIDMSAVPEAPVTATPVAASKAEAGRAEAKMAEAVAPEAAPTPAATAPAPAPGGTSVQLGAFSSNASAEAAWAALSGRFAALDALPHNVQGATVNGRSVFRLRANVGDRAAARELCGRLTVAGESCVIL